MSFLGLCPEAAMMVIVATIALLIVVAMFMFLFDKISQRVCNLAFVIYFLIIMVMSARCKNYACIPIALILLFFLNLFYFLVTH